MKFTTTHKVALAGVAIVLVVLWSRDKQVKDAVAKAADPHKSKLNRGEQY